MGQSEEATFLPGLLVLDVLASLGVTLATLAFQTVSD